MKKMIAKAPETSPAQRQSPCANCPFRSDIEFSLSAEKVALILLALQGDLDFPCHNTTAAIGCKSGNEKGCIGAAIFLEHTREDGLRANRSFRIRESECGEFSRELLDMNAPVFTTEAAFVTARAN